MTTLPRLAAGAAAVLLSLLAARAGDLPRPASPAPVEEVHGEPVVLPAGPVTKWSGGARLAHVQGFGLGKGLPIPHALDAESVVVRQGGHVLRAGADYVVNGIYGTLSLGPAPAFDAAKPVAVDYRVGRRRLDSVIRTAAGALVVREGAPDPTIPEPPPLVPGETRLGNYFLDYFATSAGADYFPVSETAAQAPTRTSPRGLDHVLAKLQAGGPVTVVCWGDSVTHGSEASDPSRCYPALFEDGLRKRFPGAQIQVKVVAVGGSQSRQWLHPDQYPHPTEPAACRFERVAAEHPDLVTVEFVNDAWMTEAEVGNHYREVVDRVRGTGADIVLVTPNFTLPEMMGTSDLRTPESRGYVKGLLAFAERDGVAVADASGRWAHLWKEGIPYVTLLHNGINHPGDAGHRLFAEELLNCLSPSR